MKKIFLSILSLSILFGLVSCSESNNNNISSSSEEIIQNSSTIISSNNESSSSSHISQDHDDNIDDLTTPIDVNFGSLKKTADNLESESEGAILALDNLKNVINKDLKTPIVSNITCKGKVQIHGHQMTSNKNDPYYNYLIIGGKKYDGDGNPICDGQITFEFTRNIKEITFKTKGFHKFNYSTEPGVIQQMNYDQDIYADVLVNDVKKIDGIKINECKTFDDPQTLINLTLDDPSNIITLKTHENKLYNRFFLEGLTLTCNE